MCPGAVQSRSTREVGAGKLRLFGLHDGPAQIVPAVRANRVRGDRLAAVGAAHQLTGLLGIVRPAAAGAGVAVFSLGDGHVDSLLGQAARKAGWANTFRTAAGREP